MVEFDRSKFKGAQIASVKKVSDDAKKQAKSFGDFDNGNYVNFFKIEDGINTLRVAPSVDDNSPYIPVRTSMLKCKVQKRDVDGNVIEEFEIKNKKIFISSFHSTKDQNGKPTISKDVIETYIGYVVRQAENNYTKGSDDFKKYLNPINGYMSSGKWVSGIKPSTEFVCYGWNGDGELVRAGLFESWMKKINEISLKESGDNVLAIDIFSDPETGYPLSITKRKNDKQKYEYIIDADRPARGESWEAFFKRCNPTDEQLMKLTQVPSLKDTYIGVYSDRDFKLAMDGLKRFDEEHGYDIFSNDEFLDEVEEIAKIVPEKTKTSTESEKTEKEQPKKEPKIDVVSKKESEKVTPIAAKKFLREYISENYGDEFTLPTLSTEDLMVWYNLAKQNEELPFKTESVEVEEQEEEESNSVESAPSTEPSIDVQQRIAKLRAMRNKQ